MYRRWVGIVAVVKGLGGAHSKLRSHEEKTKVFHQYNYLASSMVDLSRRLPDAEPALVIPVHQLFLNGGVRGSDPGQEVLDAVRRQGVNWWHDTCHAALPPRVPLLYSKPDERKILRDASAGTGEDVH